VVVDRNVPYSMGYTSCMPDTVVQYTVALPGGGPFRLEDWQVDGEALSGYFTSIYELANLVNVLDPDSDWSLQNNAMLLGGDPAKTYGPLHIIPAVGDTAHFQPSVSLVQRGTELTFLPGEHIVVFRRLQTGCQDTVVVLVECLDCPPFHNYIPDATGLLTFSIPDCDAGTVLCTTIPEEALDHHTVLVDGLAYDDFETCPGDFAGIRLDTGSFEIVLNNVLSGCQDAFTANVTCQIVVADTTIAMPDDASTLKNTTVQIPVLMNDLINGITGNTTGIGAVTLLTLPPFGTAAYDPQTGLVSYTPGNDRCEEVQFVYRITDTQGRSSSATVTVNIRCDRILVYNGLSPNNDGANDLWRIDGIEQYPDNEVRVFNRWGNLVFERQGYSNDLPWDGEWNGRYLPDGTYFYVIDLGDGSGAVSGYLQILR
jgi:gliding motility-associated-like protein